MQTIKEYVKIKKQELKEEINNRSKSIYMHIFQVGHVPASDRYVRNKIKDLEEVGIHCSLINVHEDDPEEFLISFIEVANRNCEAGYLVQLPLPEHMDEKKIMRLVAPEKDIDGFNPVSITVPATPLGIYKYLKDMNYDFKGKNAVVIGRSDIVGRPMAKLLLDESMNVTVIHSKTPEQDKINYIKNADLIVVATGHINTLTKDYEYKDSAIIFDVGINFNEEGKLVGDCESNLPVAFQSPVPGGVGLLTRLAVIYNVLELEKKYNTL